MNPSLQAHSNRAASATPQPFMIAFCTTVWRFTSVNLTTLALMLAGGLVLGIGPASAACLWAMSRIEDEPIGVLVPGMWDEWRAEFMRSNLALMPVLVLFTGVVLALPISSDVLLVLLLVLAAGLSAWMLAIVYVISHIRCSARSTLANAARLLLVAPMRLLGALATVPPLLLVTAWQPLFALYGLFSVVAWVTIVLMGNSCGSARPTLPIDRLQPERMT